VPHRNRVTPFGEIVAVQDRGTLYGNRGVLHDPTGRLVCDWQVRRWIACRLEFRGRWRPPIRPNRYTGLFFLDEATALAAGHRPCAECRYQDYQRFRWAFVPPGRELLGADDIDRGLHGERLGPGGTKRTHPARPGELPDGAMVAVEGRPWLVLDGELLAWTPGGYRDRRPLPASEVDVLTPPSILAAIRRGYRPAMHPSAIGR